MKAFYGKEFNNLYTINHTNNQTNQLYQNFRQYTGSANNIKEHNYFNQNKNQIINNINNNNNLNYLNNNNTNQPLKINRPINFPKKKKFNYMKNLNPTHMKYNNGASASINMKKKSMNKNIYRNQEKGFVNMGNPNNYNNNQIKKNISVRNSISISKNNNNHPPENSKRKMGMSQMNFFPNIHNQRPNLNSINDNWMIYSHQQQRIYNDLFNNIIRNNPQNISNENLANLFEFEYKRPEEKLKKGQNQLILERLQKKYVTQIREKPQNMHRTGTDFFHKNNTIRGRQRSAQDNINDSFKGILDINKKNQINDNIKEKNNIDNNKIEKEKNTLDDSKNKKEKLFNKTYNGFNLKKKNKEKKKKEKIIFSKIIKYFNKKSNYFWIKNFNKKIKNKEDKEDKEQTNLKKNKSFDNNNLLLYGTLIKKLIKTHLIYKKINYNNKNELKYNTDNSEIDEIKEYKKWQKKFKNGKSDYANFIKPKNHYKEDDKNNSLSESENSTINKNEPKFKGIFDNDNQNSANNNNNENNRNENNNNDKKRFNFKTTSNFYNKHNNNFNSNFNSNYNTNNNNQDSKNTDDKTYSKEEGKKYKDDFDKEKKNKFNIENIINNVIENNKKAAAARSSTSFYNIGSHFMNNHMRSTKTKFYNPRENRGGGFTGTKDSNFTKEQANEGKFYKSNSLKLTLINPINWRKHEEIWDNLISLSLGLADLEKYLVPPNETDVLVSSYLKMNPRILNFCSIQKINTSNTKNENNFISFMIDDNIQNPKQEMKKWKEAYKRVIFRWHPDKLFSALEEIKFKNEQQKNELKKKSSLIINSTNTLYKNIMEILNKILLAKNQNNDK